MLAPCGRRSLSEILGGQGEQVKTCAMPPFVDNV
jgi:hypothetical protein